MFFVVSGPIFADFGGVFDGKLPFKAVAGQLAGAREWGAAR